MPTDLTPTVGQFFMGQVLKQTIAGGDWDCFLNQANKIFEG